MNENVFQIVSKVTDYFKNDSEIMCTYGISFKIGAINWIVNDIYGWGIKSRKYLSMKNIYLWNVSLMKIYSCYI